MARTKGKTSATVMAEPIILDEMIGEGLEPWVKKLERLRRSKKGSAAYRNALVDLWTLSNIIEIKAKVAGEMIDEYLDGLPDDGD